VCKPGTSPRIGLFGGAFNPPHWGHLLVAETARDRLGLDLVYWIPAARPPHKEIAPEDPAPEDRAAMVSAAIGDHPAFRLLDLELNRPGPSWSIDTARVVAALHPEAELHFILGADALAGLSSWREPEALARLVTFAVHGRGPAPVAALSGARVVDVAGPLIGLSSSALRRDLLEARSVRYAIPEPAARIIEERGLYLPPLPEGMRRHIEEAVEAAIALAERWGLSAGTLSLAARHHDLYRATSPEALLSLAENLGERIDEHERREPMLLHGRLAARRVLAPGIADPDGVRDRAADAIRAHVTGAPEMTPEAETLIVADRLGKDWARVADVPDDRRQAVRLALEGKFRTLAARGVAIHPRIEAALSAYGGRH
jgi:nicotinate-nucleotide adenylyltransferase